MEELAQGRVWTGKAAVERRLVDAIGGFHTALAIAKEKAGIAEDQPVRGGGGKGGGRLGVRKSGFEVFGIIGILEKVYSGYSL